MAAELAESELDTQAGLDQTAVERLGAVWADAGVKRCWERRSELQIPECTGDFLDSLHRVTEPGYSPSQEVSSRLDNLVTRVLTCCCRTSCSPADRPPA